MENRLEYFNVLQEKWSGGDKNDRSHLFEYVIRKKGLNGEARVKVARVRRRVDVFVTHVRERWQKSGRKLRMFLRKNSEWLKEEQSFLSDGEGCDVTMPSSSGVGRPRKSFETLTVRSKRRRTEDLRGASSAQELTFASSTALRDDGKEAAAEIVGQLFDSPKRALRIRKAWTTEKARVPQPCSYTTDEALNLMVQANLSKAQYLLLRRGAKTRNIDLYPSYDQVLLAKKRCYPAENSITVTETTAEVKLQALLDHTSQRLVLVQEPVIVSLTEFQLKSLTLMSKYGLDGSSGHSNYKQLAPDPLFTDSSLMATTIVPLQLYTHANETSRHKVIVWQNPRPSSTRFCRPLKLQFAKESTAKILEENERLAHEIKLLNASRIICSDLQLSVKHELHLTMIDGKICNALTSTASSQTCNICGAKPTQMNNLTAVSQRSVNQNALQYGLSTLHAWIRVFESLLHIAYKLDIEKWRTTTADDRAKVEQRKKMIHSRFRDMMGLVVDVPRQGGSGSSNDGNTARRFFQNPSISAEITGLEENLIKRFAVILNALSSGYEINVPVFKDYSFQTAREFVNVYPWYNMPPSVHKILVHGAIIISALPLPIGYFSEEAQESRNKDLKRYREHNTRKTSRTATNEDLLHMMLLSSDPLISSLSCLRKKKRGSLSSEVLCLLMSPRNVTLPNEDDDSDSSRSSSP